ncbi:MAG: hypothetical protein JNL98_23310 [Bryobacterales bacterium]|nr:hypothetical protein [Bryobacterales bacterium]
MRRNYWASAATLSLLVIAMGLSMEQLIPSNRTTYADLRASILKASPRQLSSKQFQRWDHFWSRRLEAGTLPQGADLLDRWKRFKNLDLTPPPLPLTWKAVGPVTSPINDWDITGANPGLGRINCIAFGTGVIYAGAATGGLWKSINNGGDWTSVPVDVPLLGVSDIAVSADGNVLYLGTGDRDGRDGVGFGVLKSTDAGQSFQTNTTPVLQSAVVSRILVHPTNPQIVLAATLSGIFRSADAGATWTQAAPGIFFDMEFKPTDPNTLYAASRADSIAANPVFVSRDAGLTWNRATGSMPNRDISRVALAVSANAPATVYAIFVNQADRTFAGLYRSTDSGASWSKRASEPNVLGRKNGGATDNEGQGEYDLALEASPTNANEVWVGGINLWKSEDGGEKWDRKSFWNRGDSTDRYVHADQHTLVFRPGSGTELWSGNDGGIARSTDGGKNWTERSNGLQISQFYTVSVSKKANYMLLGAQDNGVVVHDGTNFRQIWGADGFDGAFSPKEADTLYFALYDGHAFRSNNLGKANNRTTGDIDRDERLGPKDTVTKDRPGTFGASMEIDPSDDSIVYLGLRNLFQSKNNGRRWRKADGLPDSDRLIRILRVAPSDGRRIYVSRGSESFTSSNRGDTWTRLTISTSTCPTTFITDIAVDPQDPRRVWATSASIANCRVFRSSDAGSTWQDITGPPSTASGSIPAFRINAIARQANFPSLVYIGTDIGVFFTHDAIAPQWRSYNLGLPPTVIEDLEVHPVKNRLVAATFGRGVWEAFLLRP